MFLLFIICSGKFLVSYLINRFNVLHPTLNSSFLKSNTYMSTDKYEYQANYFAANLLLPDGFEEDVVFKRMTVEQIAGVVGVPVELVGMKVGKV